MLRPLILAGLAFVAAVALATELATRNGVGVFEYIVGIVFVAGLVTLTIELVRRALRRTASP